MIIPLFIWFHTSQVVQDFSHQQYGKGWRPDVSSFSWVLCRSSSPFEELLPRKQSVNLTLDLIFSGILATKMDKLGQTSWRQKDTGNLPVNYTSQKKWQLIQTNCRWLRWVNNSCYRKWQEQKHSHNNAWLVNLRNPSVKNQGVTVVMVILLFSKEIWQSYSFPISFHMKLFQWP